MSNCHSWPLDVSSSVKLPFHICVWGSICQSIFVYQGIFPLYLGGPLAKVCLSAKLRVLVFKASVLWPGGSISYRRFICQKSKFVCQVLCTWGAHWPMYVCLPSCVYWYSRHLSVPGGPLAKGGSSARKSRFVCQVLCTRGVHQPKKVHLPEKVGSSAKFCVCRGSISRRRFICQIWAHLQFYALLHRRSFHITYKRPNEHFLIYLFRNPRNGHWKLQNCHHCVQHPWKLTSGDFWSSRNESKPLSQQKCVLRKCCGVSQKWWMLEFSNLCHCVQHPWKLTSRDYWSSRNKSKPLSKLKHVLRKCSGVSQKWWMLELSNLLPLCLAPLKT